MTSTIQKELLEETIKLCTIPSLSSDNKEINACIQYIAQQFEQYTHAHCIHYEHANSPSLIIQNHTGKESDIILNWHIDVVPPSQEDQFVPTQKKNRLYARGAGDMKAWIAIIVKIMHMILQNNYTDKKISCIITSDEEIGGFNGAQKIAQAWYTAPIVLIPDGGSTEEIVHSQKGIFMAKIEAKGVSCHSSRPRLGENALHNIVNYFQMIREELQDTQAVYATEHHRGTSVNLNMLQGGHAINALADKAYAHIDIRFTDKYSVNIIRKKLLSHTPSFKCSLIEELTGDIVYTPPTHPLLQQYLQTAKKHVSTSRLTKEHWWSDGRFFANGESAIIIHRPYCENIHGPDEFVSIPDIYTIYTIYKDFIFWTNGKKNKK